MEIAEIHGRASALLTAERTALNFMQRMTGIATLTRQFVDAAAGRITILDTRKTTPLMRTLEKYAVRAGGGVNHRFGLSDGILIKDNHVRLAGGVCNAVARMRASKPDLPIEVEAQSLSEVADALQAGADIVLLDNLSTPDIIDAVRQCRGRAKTEISGGVTLARMPELAGTGADYRVDRRADALGPGRRPQLRDGVRSRSDSMTLPDDLATALADGGRSTGHLRTPHTLVRRGGLDQRRRLPRSPIVVSRKAPWWWRTRSRRAADATVAPGPHHPARDSTCPRSPGRRHTPWDC